MLRIGAVPVLVDVRRRAPADRPRRWSRRRSPSAPRRSWPCTSSASSRRWSSSRRSAGDARRRRRRGRRAVPGRTGTGRGAGTLGDGRRRPASTRARTSALPVTPARSPPTTRRSPPRCAGCATTAGRRQYVHDVIGMNSRLDTMQAVVLRAKLAGWRTGTSAARGRRPLRPSCSADVPGVAARCTAGRQRGRLAPLRRPGRRSATGSWPSSAAGVGAGIHYPDPVHLTGAYAHLGLGRGTAPVAETAAGEILSLPMYPHITAASRSASSRCSPTRWRAAAVTTLLVANDGGHLMQLHTLRPRLGVGDDVVWVTPRTPQTESLLAGERVHWALPCPPAGHPGAGAQRRCACRASSPSTTCRWSSAPARPSPSRCCRRRGCAASRRSTSRARPGCDAPLAVRPRTRDGAGHHDLQPVQRPGAGALAVPRLAVGALRDGPGRRSARCGRWW